MKTSDYLSSLVRNDGEKRLLARLGELIARAALGTPGCSDFLDLRQQELARAAAVNGAARWKLDGGYEEAERKRLIVYPEWLAGSDARIAYVRISHRDIGETHLGHSDYLGAILNLGIKREKLGDIVVKNNTAVVMVDVNLGDYICQQLNRVKHSSVAAGLIPAEAFVYEPPELTRIKLSLSSLRLDAAVAAVFHLSRSEAETLIENGLVKLNQLETGKSFSPVKTGDLISVRGQGRFRLEEVGGLSRKGRCQVWVSRW